LKELRVLSAKAQTFLSTGELLLKSGDYGMGRSVTEDEAKKLVESAREFIRTVDEYLNTWQEKEQGT
jgi:uncharacterized protein (UPF0332 family)